MILILIIHCPWYYRFLVCLFREIKKQKINFRNVLYLPQIRCIMISQEFMDFRIDCLFSLVLKVFVKTCDKGEARMRDWPRPFYLWRCTVDALVGWGLGCSRLPLTEAFLSQGAMVGHNFPWQRPRLVEILSDGFPWVKVILIHYGITKEQGRSTRGRPPPPMTTFLRNLGDFNYFGLVAIRHDSFVTKRSRL